VLLVKAELFSTDYGNHSLNSFYRKKVYERKGESRKGFVEELARSIAVEQ